MTEKKNQTPYPKPGQSGGVLMRALVKSFRDAKIKIPITSHIQIAVSGGADSIALALALLKYGRRVVGRDLIILSHFNHGWRGSESDQDALFVEAFAKTQDAQFRLGKMPTDEAKDSERTSREEKARTARYGFLKSVAATESCALTLTAHHLEDQVETLVWRLFTGDFLKLPEGIRVRHEGIFRPLLVIEPSTLREFLKEEGQEWREDSSNLDTKYLRNALRANVLPEIRKLYPSADRAILELSRKIKALKHSIR